MLLLPIVSLDWPIHVPVSSYINLDRTVIRVLGSIQIVRSPKQDHHHFFEGDFDVSGAAPVILIRLISSY